MQKYQNTVAWPNGNVAQGVSVLVQTYPGAATATIYSDNGVTTQANPITTDSLGGFSFFAADGDYQLVISGAGFVTQTLTAIQLVDLIPFPAASPSFSSVISAPGLQFPAVQVPSADVNTLDDYEEALDGGSFWTPTDQSGFMSLSNTSGRYVKMGRLVYVDCQFTCAANVSGATVEIGGFPFASMASPRPAMTIGLSTVGVPLYCYLRSGSLQFTVASTGANAVNSLFSGATLFVSGWYMTDA